MPQDLSLFGIPDAPLSLASLMLGLGVGVVLSVILSWHFRRFGSTLSNREEFSHVFPFILLTTVLIISVVKSSLALSLGLVGALSIVRFRTPIKEPEELAYLFIAIAMGLGLGANQTLPTVAAGLSILGVIAAFKWRRRAVENRSVFLSVDLQSDETTDPKGWLEQLNELVSRHTRSSDLRRFHARPGSLEATYILDVAAAPDLSALAGALRDGFPGAGVTFLDQSRLPSV